MGDKSKYDIMDEISLDIALNMAEFMADFSLYDDGVVVKEIDDGMLSSDDVVEKLKGILLNLKIFAHFDYEIAKDLFCIDYKEILYSLRKNGINVDKFNEGYSKMLNRYAKTLLVFLIVEEEELNIIEFGEASNELIKGNTECLLKEIKESCVTVSPENYELVVKMADDNFYVGDLSNNQIQRLNAFHEDFMRRKIYPKITKVADEKNKTLEKVIATVKLNDLY